MTTAIQNKLTPAEAARLAELMPIVERHILGFKECGAALGEIGDKRLYRETHDTFKDWVQDKYSMSAARAYQLIEASELAESLPPKMSKLLTNDNQARELAKVPKAKREKVLKVAAESGPVTAKAIKEAALEVVPPPTTEYFPASESHVTTHGASPAQRLKSANAIISSFDNWARLHFTTDHERQWGLQIIANHIAVLKAQP